MGAKEIILAVNNTMKDKYNIVGMIDDNKNKLNKSILGVKVLGTGTLTKKLTVQVNAFSASAKEKIESLGGKAEVI